MPKAPPKPEVAFFATLMSKEAVELDPEVQAMLGGDNIPPEQLDALEASAAAPQAEEPAAVEALPQEDTPPEEEAVPPPDRGAYGRLFTERRAHPLLVLEVLTGKYGTEWADWEPETVWWAIRKDFGPVGTLMRDKIMALRIAATTDVPWNDWDTFENCGLAWNDITPVFNAIQLMTPMQCAFAVQVLRGIREDEEFGHEISAYIAAILDDHGFVYAPEEWFPGVQAILDRREWLADFRDELAAAWPTVRTVPAEDIDWDETNPRDMHLLKMSVIDRYLQGREGLRSSLPGAPSVTSAAPPVP